MLVDREEFHKAIARTGAVQEEGGGGEGGREVARGWPPTQSLGGERAGLSRSLRAGG